MSKEAWEGYWSDATHRDDWSKPASVVTDLISSLSPAERPRVLDLGCGPGRHAIAFAQAGFDVSATDVSEEAVRHLAAWAQHLGLRIDVRRCEMLEQPFPPDTFDLVVSYNVIYHGLRETFRSAIDHVRSILKPGGLFFYTCPSRDDGKYGFGQEVGPHAFACTKSITPGEVHYFSSRQDLDDLLKGYHIEWVRKDEGRFNRNGEDMFYSNWHMLASKPSS
jgi:tellurite methyltransferase